MLVDGVASAVPHSRCPEHWPPFHSLSTIIDDPVHHWALDPSPMGGRVPALGEFEDHTRSHASFDLKGGQCRAKLPATGSVCFGSQKRAVEPR